MKDDDKIECHDHAAIGSGSSGVRNVFSSLDAVVAYWRERTPDRVAIMDHDGRCVSWAILDALVGEAAQELSRHGVRPGHRVALILENALSGIVFLFACSRLGAWAVVINARLSAIEIGRMMDHCQPQASVFFTGVSDDARSHAERCGALRADQWNWDEIAILAGGDTAVEPVAPGEADRVAVMIYTSGTTGQPKGVMLTHRGILYVAQVGGGLREMTPDDISYLVLPISHVFGLSSALLGTLAYGGTVWIARRFDVAAVLRVLEAGVSVFQGVPAMYAAILAQLGPDVHPHAPALRFISAGGSPLDIGWKDRTEAAFGLPLINGYGLTETSPTVVQTRLGTYRADDSVGYAMPDVEVRIEGLSGPIEPGETGELWIRGPSVFAGYYRDPHTTAQVMTDDSWFKTGDLARQDSDGALFIVGRIKELIIRSGFNVYPSEVEAAINRHPGVVQSAVVGRPNGGDEEIVAFVQLRADASLSSADLLSFVHPLLAPYKRPQQIRFLDRLPASGTGKILKKQLSTMALEELNERKDS